MPAADVVVYVTGYCPYCTRAKALLTKKGAAFREVDVSSDEEKRVWLAKATGQRTVPQIFINDVSIGGFDELATLDRQGKLDPLLAVAKQSTPG